MAPAVVELLDAAIPALAAADGGRLEALAETARRAVPPATAQEWERAQVRLRALGILLELTRRNLRLLRGADGYGPLQGSCRLGDGEAIAGSRESGTEALRGGKEMESGA
ncbi:MAG: hypothetical protein ACLGXA_22210 [Acidobacteriota bacterium]